MDGQPVGWIEQVIKRKEVSFTSRAQATKQVVGYRLVLRSEENEQEFKTLAEARAAARKFFAAV